MLKLKNTSILILIFVLFPLSLKSTQAALTDNLMSHLSFDIDFTDDTGNYHSSPSGVGITTSSCKLGNCTHLDGSNDYIAWSDNMTFGTSYTFNCWIKFDDDKGSNNVHNPIIGETNGAIGTPLDFYYHGNNDDYRSYAGNGGSQTQAIGFASYSGDSTWAMHTLVANHSATSHFLYIDGNFNASGDYSPQVVTNSVATILYLGRRADAGTGYFDGWYDECSIYNVSLTQNDILMLYENGTGCNPVDNPSGCGGGDPPSPSLTLSTSILNNTGNHSFTNFSYTFQGSFSNENTNWVNCSHYVNSNLNSTQNLLLNTTHTYNLSIGSYSNTLNISLNCSNYELTSETGTYILHVDNIPPVIQIEGITNLSTYIKDTTLTLTSNLTDLNLFAYNITLLDSSNTVLQNKFSTNLTNITSILNITSYQFTDTGNYSWSITVWDSHTDNTVKPLKWWITDGTIILDDNIYITGSLKQENSYFYLSEDNTKYKFKITFNNTSYFHNFNLSTDNSIFYLPNSNYKGHFVLFDHKRYIDFEGSNIKKVSSILISPNVYSITIELFNQSDEIEIESSIGDLNEFSETYTFTIFSQDTQYLQSIDTTLTNIYGVINMIPILMLYIFITGFSFYFITHKNIIAGFLMGITSIGFDFFLSGWLYNYLTNITATGFYQSMINISLYFIYFYVFTKMLLYFAIRFNTFKR